MTTSEAPAAAPEGPRADVRKRPAWWDQYPGLHLLIYPERDHLKLVLVYKHRPKGRQTVTRTLIEARWAPPEVTEERCVDWANRALAAYLAAIVAPDE